MKAIRLLPCKVVASLGFLFLSSQTFATLDEEALAKRIYAHLIVHDFASACEESNRALEKYPESITLFEAYVKALARHSDEKELNYIWNKHISRFPDSKEKREILEAISWSVIEKGYNNTSPLIRIMGLLGAFFGNDVKGVEIIHKSMSDPNYLVRAIAVKLAGGMRDAKIKDQVFHCLQYDKNWEVRLNALKSAGEMKILESKPLMMTMIASDHTTAEEKAVATQALVNMLDNIERAEIAKLAVSSRAGLRVLASQVVEHLDRKEDLDLIFPLLNDFHPEVRRDSLKTIALLKASTINGQPIKPIISQKLYDLDTETAITAAWALTLIEPEEGVRALKPWLTHHEKETRLVAAAALSATGKSGIPLMRQAFKETTDPYVKMNLALGLISQRIETQAACQALYEGLSLSERWMWDEKSSFKTLAPSEVKHDDLIPNYPESVNQQVRLEILNILAVMKFPGAQLAIRNFLQEKVWGITGIAAVVLLTEGDETAVDLVRGLLKDPDQKIRLQAALILSSWGEGDEAITVLKDAYPTVDREMKERILESFGRIGSKAAIPFLTEQLQETYQSLRIIAAAALLQCLYH